MADTTLNALQQTLDEPEVPEEQVNPDDVELADLSLLDSMEPDTITVMEKHPKWGMMKFECQHLTPGEEMVVQKTLLAKTDFMIKSGKYKNNGDGTIDENVRAELHNEIMQYSDPTPYDDQVLTTVMLGVKSHKLTMEQLRGWCTTKFGVKLIWKLHAAIQGDLTADNAVTRFPSDDPDAAA